MLLDSPTIGLPVSPADSNSDWLKAAAAQGHGAVAYQLGLSCTDPAERLYWLREAAHEKYPPAMYAYALECDRLSERMKWLRKWLRTTAREDHPEAVGVSTNRRSRGAERSPVQNQAANVSP
jgi:hypothetical protein